MPSTMEEFAKKMTDDIKENTKVVITNIETKVEDIKK